MGRIAALARPYRPQLLGAVALWLVASSSFLVLPLGIRGLVDTAFARTGRGALDRLALGLLGVFVAQAGVSFAASYLLSWTGERIVADFRRRIYAHLHRLSLRFFDDEPSGGLTARLTSDVESVRTAITGAMSELLTVGLRVAGSAVLLVLLSWRLGLMILVVIPAAAFATRALGERIRLLSRGAQDRLADTAAIADETLSSMRLVAAFARGPYEVGRYGEAVDALFTASRRRDVARAALSSVIVFLFFAPIAGIFWFGALEVMRGRLTPGDLVASFFYATNVSQGIGFLANIFGAFSSAAGASERVFEILDTEPEIEDAPGAVPLPPVRGRVRFEGVTFGYDPRMPVLQEIDLEVAPGETLALVGPSGAGKTTLLGLIPRFREPVAGRVTIDGHDLRAVRLLSLREQVAVVSQDVQLFNSSIRENIRYGRLDATDAEVEQAARDANAHDFVASLADGYETVVGERGMKLSGGQRQRIAIARALLKAAPILLLDEATSALDSESEMLVQQALQRLMRGRTSVVVAHRLATVRDADRIVVLERGRVVEVGTHEELTARRGLYSRLAARQFMETNDERTAARGRRAQPEREPDLATA
jgi:subfamily B ATP-binding cassette protein MsbA